MAKFYSQQGARAEALKSGIEYETLEDLEKIISGRYPLVENGAVRLVKIVGDIDYNNLVTLNGMAVGFTGWE